jgi:hypothetical protein
MISFWQAARANLMLAPMALGLWFIAYFTIRHLKSLERTPEVVHKLNAYRIVAYLCLLVFVITLMFWIGFILAMRFDWNRSDVSEIKIMVFSSPYPLNNPEYVVHITHPRTLCRLLNTLSKLEPYESDHEHATGTTYAVKLRRQSNREWSKYVVVMSPARQITGGLSMKDAYVVSINYRSHWFNLGGYHQAVDFGRLVEELARQ